MARRDWPAWLRAADIVDLVRLSLPVAASRAAVPVMSATDVIVLGRNAQLELPYITNGYLLVSVGLAIGMGILQGVQVFTAELAGAGEQHNTGRVFRRGLWVGGGLGLLFTLGICLIATPLFNYLLIDVPAARAAANGVDFDLAEAGKVAAGTISATFILSYGLVWHMLVTAGSLYLEALRRPAIVTALMYGGVLVNLVIDLALVAGWAGVEPMGADGVAWATTGTRVALTLAFLVIVWRLTPGFAPSEPAPADEAYRQHTVGAGGAIANVAEYGGFNLTFIIATWSSIQAATLYSLALQPVFMTFMLFSGLGTAVSVRVAEAFGRHDQAGVRDASRLGLAAGTVMGLVLTLGMWLAQEPIAGLMVRDEPDAGILLVSPLIALISFTALVVLFDGMQAVASMALRAQEVVWPPAAIQIASYFLILLPNCYVFALTLDRGAQGVMEGVLVASVFAASAQTLVLLKKSGAPEVRRAAQR